MNEKHRDGNGRDTVSGLTETAERRILSGVTLAKRVIYGIVSATAFVLITYFGIVARQTRADTAIEQQGGAIVKLEAEKQSREAADGQTRVILEKLDAIEKRSIERFDEINKRTERIERRLDRR